MSDNEKCQNEGFKPCPFCGELPEVVDFGDLAEFPIKVYCGNHDGCRWYMGTHFPNKQEALDSWNHRPELKALQDKIAELEKKRKGLYASRKRLVQMVRDERKMFNDLDDKVDQLEADKERLEWLQDQKTICYFDEDDGMWATGNGLMGVGQTIRESIDSAIRIDKAEFSRDKARK